MKAFSYGVFVVGSEHGETSGMVMCQALVGGVSSPHFVHHAAVGRDFSYIL